LKPRRLARILAMQALFEIDAVGHDPERTLGHRFDEVTAAPEVQEFCRRLTWGVLTNKDALDEYIRRHASAWPLEEIAILDRVILRMGTYELLHEGETPPRVVINEAVELAKRFGNESTRRFVNGVLGAVLTELEQAGRLPRSRPSKTTSKSTSASESNS
jgi:transcription antitermination protein NusB